MNHRFSIQLNSYRWRNLEFYKSHNFLIHLKKKIIPNHKFHRMFSLHSLSNFLKDKNHIGLVSLQNKKKVMYRKKSKMLNLSIQYNEGFHMFYKSPSLSKNKKNFNYINHNELNFCMINIQESHTKQFLLDKLKFIFLF